LPFEFHLPSLEEMRATPDGIEMLRMIDDDNFRGALVTGCPGSGKTTVSIYRLVRLNNQAHKVRLVTYQNMLVLAIQNLANVQRVPAHRVSTFHRWYCRLIDGGFDTDSPPTAQEMVTALDDKDLANQDMVELLIDEGQDLPPCVYDVLPRYFQRIFVGADNGQQVHPCHGAQMEQIEQSLRSRSNQYRRFTLGRNFRNTYETYRFARQFIPKTNRVAWDEAILERLLHANRRGPIPTVVTYQNVESRNAHLQVTLQNAEGNVAILCPLGPLPRNFNHSGESVDEVHRLIENMGFSVSKYHSQADVPRELHRYVVTTFKSAKGMEFDTVIIPRINFFKEISKEWFVACTRARNQLFVYRDLSVPQCDPIEEFEIDTFDSQPAETHITLTEDDISF